MSGNFGHEHHNHRHDHAPRKRSKIDAFDMLLVTYIGIVQPITLATFIASEIFQWGTPEIRIGGVLGAEALEFGLFLGGAFLTTRGPRRGRKTR